MQACEIPTQVVALCDRRRWLQRAGNLSGRAEGVILLIEAPTTALRQESQVVYRAGWAELHNITYRLFLCCKGGCREGVASTAAQLALLSASCQDLVNVLHIQMPFMLVPVRTALQPVCKKKCLACAVFAGAAILPSVEHAAVGPD